MTKQGVLYVVIILIIGIVICSLNVEIDYFIHDNEKAWYPNVDDAYNIVLCYKKCNKGYNTLSKKSRNRLSRCRKMCKRLNDATKWCRTRCHNDEVAYKKCITQWRHFLRGNPTERQIENYRINNDECT
ncbi:hypothetical protein AAHE18_02G193900 [Arachis hypogaea]|nr:uncharacterized protein DS421_12g384810 [Arachis hypogaea]